MKTKVGKISDIDHHEALREMKRFEVNGIYYQASVIPCRAINRMIDKHLDNKKILNKTDLKIITDEITYRDIKGIEVTGALRKITIKLV